jgi:hypothetical protein
MAKKRYEKRPVSTLEQYARILRVSPNYLNALCSTSLRPRWRAGPKKPLPIKNKPRRPRTTARARGDAEFLKAAFFFNLHHQQIETQGG